jgi:DNA polymerase-3 subunit gamma/tau
MSYLVLARKYRPQSFEAVIEQRHVTTTLANAITAGRVAHAMLFAGPRGTGKTTIARILAKAMNCADGPTANPCNTCRSCREITAGHAADVFEIDGASNNSVDQIRDLRENVKYRPAHSPYKIYIIDEVHMLSPQAFNALLKTLEEPPEHVLFFFATTEPHKIPITILSRCQRHDLKRVRIDAIVGHMRDLSRREGYDVSADSLTIIAREAGGSMRDALSLLDQVMACSEKTIGIEQVLDILGVIDRNMLFEISAAVIQRDVPGLLRILDDAYDRGYDLKRLYLEMVEHFRNLLVVQMGRNVKELVDLPGHEIERLQGQLQDVSPAELNQIFDLFCREEAAIRFATHPKLTLETAFLRMFQVQPTLTIDRLIEKLDLLRKEINELPGCEPCSGLPPDSGNASSFTACDSEGSRSASCDHPALQDLSEAPAAAADGRAAPQNRQDFQTVWEKVQAKLLESHPALAANLIKSRVKLVSPNRVEIEVNGNGFNLSMIQRKKNLQIIQTAFNTLFDADIEVTVAAGKSAAVAGQPPKKDVNRMKTEALSHPLVADAVEIFDGKVIDVKLSEEDDS